MKVETVLQLFIEEASGAPYYAEYEVAAAVYDRRLDMRRAGYEYPAPVSVWAWMQRVYNWFRG